MTGQYCGRRDLPTPPRHMVDSAVISRPYSVQFGASADIPAVDDYDGDGRADLAFIGPRTAFGTCVAPLPAISLFNSVTV